MSSKRPRLDGSEARAILRLSEREDVAPLIADIVAGIIRNISCGYIVYRYEITKVEGQRELWRATDWEPTEISFVPVPADAGAGTRAADRNSPAFSSTRAQPPITRRTAWIENALSSRRSRPCHFPGRVTPPVIPAGHPGTGRAGRRCDPREPASQVVVPPAAVVTPPTPVDVAAEVQRALIGERERAATIRERVRTVGLPDDVADELVRSGVAVDHVGNRIVDEIAKRGTGMTQPRMRLVEDHTDPEKIRTRMAEASWPAPP